MFLVQKVFFLNTLLGVIRQNIDSSVCLALSVINLNVVSRKFLNLAYLSEAQILYLIKLSEVIIVSKYKNFMLKAL